MKTKRIEVLIANSQADFDKNGAVMTWEMETVKAAKERAKYLLTKEYASIAEASEPYGYAQVLVNGECVADFGA